MSDEEESNVNSEQEEDDEENSEQEEDEDDDQDQDESGQDGDEDDEDESGSGSGSGSGDEDEDDQEQSGKEQQDEQQQNKKLPTFNMPVRQPPQEFKFTSLLSEISSLSNSVQSFIGTLHSSSDAGYGRRPYVSTYAAQQPAYQPRLSQIKVPQPPTQSRVVMMKDEDTQVDMKPQIIIQPTKPIKEETIVQAKPYKISTQSQKFLAQLYEQNKRLKRWQTNPTHPMTSYMTSFSNSNQGFYNSKQKFQRKQYQKGLFNIDQRNKQIDEAIMMLKRQQENQ